MRRARSSSHRRAASFASPTTRACSARTVRSPSIAGRDLAQWPGDRFLRQPLRRRPDRGKRTCCNSASTPQSTSGRSVPFVPSNPTDVDAFNIGNLPLAITATSDLLRHQCGGVLDDGRNTERMRYDWSDEGRTGLVLHHRCGSDGRSFGLQPRVLEPMTVTSNAVNAPTVTAALTGTSSE